VFNLGFDKPSNLESNWIYYPGNEIFYRIGFYDNIFKTNQMSLYVEIGMDKNQEVNEEYLLNKVLEDLVKVGVVNEHKLIDHQIIIMNPAYVHITKESKKVYDDWNKKNNPNGLFSIGRYGSWTYCSIEDNIIQSKELINDYLYKNILHDNAQ
jgi:protoporphyrinogen oxidase